MRIKHSGRNGRTYEYLQIVESYREGESVRQRVVASLGRRDEFVASGRLDALLCSLAKFSSSLRIEPIGER